MKQRIILTKAGHEQFRENSSDLPRKIESLSILKKEKEIRTFL